jgi:hypothetical protein
LRSETLNGPAFRRYNHDGFGETYFDAPWLSEGIGRLWPIFTGGRGEYEIALGQDPTSYTGVHAAVRQRRRHDPRTGLRPGGPDGFPFFLWLWSRKRHTAGWPVEPAVRSMGYGSDRSASSRWKVSPSEREIIGKPSHRRVSTACWPRWTQCGQRLKSGGLFRERACIRLSRLTSIRVISERIPTNLHHNWGKCLGSSIFNMN